MDFFSIKERYTKNGEAIEVYPDFLVQKSRDLMIRGSSFYAIWLGDETPESDKLWSTDEYVVQRVVDTQLANYAEALRQRTNAKVIVKYMKDFSTSSWRQFRNYMSQLSDNAKQLDSTLAFLNSTLKKTDYASKRLPYSLESGDTSAYEELISTLYSKEEREKFEWAIGAIISGDSLTIDKFLVFYGAPGTGKSTVMNIIQKLFDGYYVAFDAKALTSKTNAFAAEVFRSNPLVAIQHDTDMSQVETNSLLNSVVSHEEITMNVKNKPVYTMRANSFLFAGTNKPVKISDAKSGLIRRLIDVHPTGNRVSVKKYNELISRIENFERGGIAHYCLGVYKKLGKNYYSSYVPLDMIYQTDTFFNYVEENYFIFSEAKTITLNRAYEMYKEYVSSAGLEYKLPRHKFREELKNYFAKFHEILRVDNKPTRSVYEGFLKNKIDSNSSEQPEQKEETNWLDLKEVSKSLLDLEYAECSAQKVGEDGIPKIKWAKNTTKLKDIDPTELHYVKPPEHHIVIDFDIRAGGKKSLSENIEAASSWPKTYAELSKSGAGLHLHYFYSGDTTKLSNIFDEHIEILKFNGDSTLRRRLTRANNLPIATISEGLPIKEEKVINHTAVKNEKNLRKLILRNLHKEIHPSTILSVMFIHKILDDAYEQGLHYDVTDMRDRLLSFAASSTNQSLVCIKLVGKMKFKSDEPSRPEEDDEAPIVHFDVEVLPNLFVICWKYHGTPASSTVAMVNPTPEEVEGLFRYRLVGFNNRRYDNHILYARYIGYSLEDLFKLSSKIVTNEPVLFSEAYNISYADTFDFSSIRQSLKKFELELGLTHKELDLPWDQPVDEKDIPKVIEYCKNDVISQEAVFNDRASDFNARRILADLSGLTVNDSTTAHTARLIFGQNKNPKDEFVYTDLSVMYPGYKFDGYKSTYKGVDVGEGGYVFAKPGVYRDVLYMDITSMHPTSIKELNLFGPQYTKVYWDLVSARVAIKQGDYDTARKLFDGKLTKYLENESEIGSLAESLKLVINRVYGLTDATFDNIFRDPRNKDNIVAKRGALFMIDLVEAVLKYIEAHPDKKHELIHIKTDSVKVSNWDEDIMNFIQDFGHSYKYDFKVECYYSKMALVNDAVYIAQYAGGKKDGKYEAVGAQFAQKYVFKTLFSGEDLEFSDFTIFKSVTGSKMYLDLNSGLPDGEHNYTFVGKVGVFTPVVEPYGGDLLREKDGKYHHVVGTKGYRWMESVVLQELGLLDKIDYSFFEEQVKKAIDSINNVGSFEDFMKEG